MRIMMAFAIIMRMAPAPMTVPAMAMDVMVATVGMGGIAGRRAGYQGRQARDGKASGQQALR